MGRGDENKERAKELRQRAAEAGQRSQDLQWHPTDGKDAADEEDRLFRKARDVEYGDGEESSD